MNKSIAAFQAAVPDAAGMNMLVFILVVLVTFNFFVELAVNLVATPALHRVIRVAEKQYRGNNKK